MAPVCNSHSDYERSNVLFQQHKAQTHTTINYSEVFGNRIINTRFVSPVFPLEVIINDETLEKVSQFTYLLYSISYQFSNDVESKMAKFLKLIGTFKKVRKETIFKKYNTLVLPTFLYGSENWTLTALQRRRIEAAKMKLSRPLAGYILYDHKTKDSIRREIQITGILNKTDEYKIGRAHV